MGLIYSGFHYIAFAIGFSAILWRWRVLKDLKENKSLEELFNADNLWGVAALLWVITGLLRLFGSFDKGFAYYLSNHWFYAKMALFAFVFILEIRPMVTFIGWRAKGKSLVEEGDLSKLSMYKHLSFFQIVIVLLIPFFAVCMARNL